MLEFLQIRQESQRSQGLVQRHSHRPSLPRSHGNGQGAEVPYVKGATSNVGGILSGGIVLPRAMASNNLTPEGKATGHGWRPDTRSRSEPAGLLDSHSAGRKGGRSIRAKLKEDRAGSQVSYDLCHHCRSPASTGRRRRRRGDVRRSGAKQRLGSTEEIRGGGRSNLSREGVGRLGSSCGRRTLSFLPRSLRRGPKDGESKETMESRRRGGRNTNSSRRRYPFGCVCRSRGSG